MHDFFLTGSLIFQDHSQTARVYDIQVLKCPQFTKSIEIQRSEYFISKFAKPLEISEHKLSTVSPHLYKPVFIFFCNQTSITGLFPFKKHFFQLVLHSDFYISICTNSYMHTIHKMFFLSIIFFVLVSDDNFCSSWNTKTFLLFFLL